MTAAATWKRRTASNRTKAPFLKRRTATPATLREMEEETYRKMAQQEARVSTLVAKYHAG